MADLSNDEIVRLLDLAAIELGMLRREVAELRPFQRAFVLLEAVISHGNYATAGSVDITPGLLRAAEQLRSPKPAPLKNDADPFEKAHRQKLAPENPEPIVFTKDETPADETFAQSIGKPVENK